MVVVALMLITGTDPLLPSDICNAISKKLDEYYLI